MAHLRRFRLATLLVLLTAVLSTCAWGQADVAPLVARGKQLKRQKKIDQAIAVLREAVIKDPSCVEGHSALGWIFMRKGDKFGATWHFRRVVVLAPDTPMGADALRALNKLDPGRPIVGYTPPPGSAPAPASVSLRDAGRSASDSQQVDVNPHAARAIFSAVVRVLVVAALAGVSCLVAFLRNRASRR